MINGLYRPGTSPIHRMRAGLKMTLLAVTCTIVFFLDVWPLAVVLACAAALYAVARFDIQTVYRQLRPALPFILLLALFQVFAASWVEAVETILRFSSLILLAALLSLTTSPAALSDALLAAMRPFKRFGLPAEQIALAMTLAIRFIPVITQASEDVREAQRARGARTGFFRSAGPTLIRTLKIADELAEALEARGYGLGAKSNEK
ncbi:energy-coupling factor transporter transmembrane component T family protein [Notoacmeibacter ruber]|uniref:Energy-coupling factor transporter transmembrane protein EcfT n=1 Tax=Notoacmeibacter ruber TaxID=2670375 RepID=A0A3L7JCP6_9HYPH|nr:energy-coupling factor transporter transmembrane protein EcfT [Notoacmeibacter ruber]RLQ88109.1 energy-coupling factor transporter transmembrane protein EcfT [Notoacmeibacter ruber]